MTSPVVTAPVNLVSDTVSSTSVRLSWGATQSSGVTYTIFQDGSPIASEVPGSPFTVNNLLPGNCYKFRVQAVSTYPGSARTALSKSVQGCTAKAPAVSVYLKPASNFKVRPDSPKNDVANSIIFTWTPSPTPGAVYTITYDGPYGTTPVLQDAFTTCKNLTGNTVEIYPYVPGAVPNPWNWKQDMKFYLTASLPGTNRTAKSGYTGYLYYNFPGDF